MPGKLLRKTDDARALPFTADAHAVGITQLRVGGQTISFTDDAQRGEMLAKLAAGELVEMQLDATTYLQRVAPNRNYTRFAKGTLRSVAKSFAGMPVLFNHDQHDVASRVGTIVSSKASKLDDGTVTFEMTLLISDPRAVEGVLRGTLDRFSIGWWPTGPVNCSVHGAPFYDENWHRLCDCWPGETVNGKLVEAVFTGAEGVEVSFVNVPAVTGTGIDQVRSALQSLCAANLNHSPGGNPPRSNRMDPIKQMLGLPPTATDEEVTRALAAHQAKMAQLELVAAGVDDVRRDAIIERLYSEGKLAIERDPAGNRVRSAHEAALRALAPDVLDAVGKTMPSLAPVGVTPMSLAPAAPGPKPVASWEQNPHLADCLDQVGLTIDDVKAFGPQHRAEQKSKDRPCPTSLRKLFASRSSFDKRELDLTNTPSFA